MSDRTCFIDDCQNPVQRRGRCEQHYPICSIEDCPKPVQARGWCWKHYSAWRTYSDPLATSKTGITPADLEILCDELILDKCLPVNGCLEWQGWRNPKGYGMLITPWRIRKEMAHRVSWTLAYGPIPDGLLVCHHCDNPPCVLPEHLFLGTHADNNNDRAAKGRTSTKIAKLTKESVLEIRESHLKGDTPQELAERFNISRKSIVKVINRTTYKWW